jgi:5-methylcytosine-specific restriction enzyme subunit McrC
MPCASLMEFYERLAHILAQRVLDRTRRGLYRSYVVREEALPYVTGRLDVQQVAQKPWDTRFRCEYEDHTADVTDNQILAWTLRYILRSGQCTERTLPAIRQAHRALRGAVTPTPITVQDCVGRLYHRLNADYHPLHALCRFILEHSGRSHGIGDRTVLPFLVNMPRLYELFVAEWLRQHLPPTIRLEAQERVTFGTEQRLHFEIDLTLYDVKTGRVLCVLDTKYKIPDHPASDDIAQVVAYAEAKHCTAAVLIYPMLLTHPLDTRIGDIRVRSLTFATAGDLDAAGQAFLQNLNVA